MLLHETQHNTKIGKLSGIWNAGNYFISGFDGKSKIADNENAEAIIEKKRI